MMRRDWPLNITDLERDGESRTNGVGAAIGILKGQPTASSFFSHFHLSFSILPFSHSSYYFHVLPSLLISCIYYILVIM